MKHEWFEKFAAGKSLSEEVDKLDPNVFQKMRNYRSTSYFERACLNILVKQSADTDVEALKAQFAKLDLDGTGLIKASELKQYIQDNKLDVDEEEVNNLINEIDYSGNG